jgi:Ca2+-binding RTX toxin-like protein
VIHADGKDTIFAGRGAVTVDGGTERLVFVGGAGKADINLHTGSAVIYDRSGPITVDGGTGASTLFGGGGNITFDDKHSKGHDLFVTGHGHAHVTLGGGSATVDGGTGKSTVTAGTGHDIFEFVAGHGGGTEVIKDFSEHKDKLELKGKYTAPPIEKVTPGGLVITLTDGTQITHITLPGVDSDVKF